jgi:SAM-dependent methyltransferase
MKDVTGNYDYPRLVDEEKAHFADIVVTDQLKEGGIHASSAWTFYWDHVGEVLARSGYSDLPGYLCRSLKDTIRPIEILSLASGYCGHELDLARRMTLPYTITCTDLNERMFERARDAARTEGLMMNFQEADLNFIAINPARYDLIFAHAAIHHVINLEYLFDQIAAGLRPNGILSLTEVVGKNRKLIWDQNEHYANALLELMPERLTRGIRLAVREDPDGMEGIRQEDILPLLRQQFVPLFEHRHGAFMRFICTHPELGRAFDPSDADARRCLSFLIASDDCAVEHRILEPLEIWGVYKAGTVPDDRREGLSFNEQRANG